MTDKTIISVRKNKFCPHCGAQNPVDAKFCGGCGQTMQAPKQNVKSGSPGAAPARPANPVRRLIKTVTSSLAWLPFHPVWLAAAIVPLCLIVFGLSSFILFANNSLAAALPGFGWWAADTPSDWMIAVSVDAEDERQTLYALHPLTGEIHPLAEGDKKLGFLSSAFILTTAPTHISKRLETQFLPDNGDSTNLFRMISSDVGQFAQTFLPMGYYTEAGNHLGLAAYPFPNNQHIIYQLQRNDLWDVVLFDIATQQTTPLVQEAAAVFTSVDPEDELITVLVINEDETRSAYVFSSRDGRQLNTLFEDADGGIVWPMPYNDKIFYTIVDEETDATTYMSDPDGADKRELGVSNIRYVPVNASHAFLPDGQRVIYTNEKGLYLAQLEGDEVRELRRGTIEILALSPNGDHLLINDINDDEQNLYLIDLEEERAVDLARDKEQVFGFFTQDGRQIIYFAREQSTNLVLYTIESGESHTLVRDGYFQPLLMPNDGRYYAYAHAGQAGGSYTINIVDTQDGSLIDVPVDRAGWSIPYDLSNNQLLFATGSQDGSEANLYLYNFKDEQLPTLLDDQAEFYYEARLLEDERILFNARFGSNNSAIYTIQPDGSERTLVLDDAMLLNWLSFGASFRDEIIREIRND